MKAPKGFVPLSDYLALKEELVRALKRIEELEARLNKNSNNSSKPPSTDGLKKVVKNNRVKSKRKPGAQKGHKGSGLKPYAEVDKEVECRVIVGVGQNLVSSLSSILKKDR